MKLRRIIQFEPKFGWSELLALLAFVFALVAFVQSSRASRPQVVVQEIPGRVSPGHPGEEDARFVGLFHVLVTNNGGRDTTLTVVRGSRSTLYMAALLNMRLVEVEDSFPWKLVIVPDTELDGELGKAIAAGRRIDVREGSILNQQIPANGGRLLLNLGLEADVYRGDRRRADRLIVNLELNFSSGDALPLELQMVIPSNRIG